ncbi:MAG TPA: carboxypeptidase regulatory-like domain-containing protein [Bryobacteraceae bacterium]|nr:carboxypeptidase regulatory-like domain-containing protein [Bryobacteraceae bacterium]
MNKRSRSGFLTLALGVFSVCAAISPLRAQVTAAISGTVQDNSGLGVSDATVVVKSVETGASRTATTDSAGNYTILSLPVGAQEVKAEKAGFKSAVRTGIDLVVGQEAVVNLQLEVGELLQQVTVAAEAPLVNTTTSQVSGVVGEQQIKDLPLNGRSIDNLVTLNPGAVNYSAMKSAGTSTSDGNTFSVDGRRTYENLFLLNGIEYTGASQLGITPGGVSGELLGIDGMREFNALTNTYGAEYGKRAGAQVIVVTQSGSNQLHGTLFEFLRNSDLDARNFFDQGSVPPFRRNQFGGALGGPVKKDKWFVFGNYEGFRQALALSNVSIVPDANARLGLLPNTAGVETPVAKLNTAMLQYMQLWPTPNGPELGSGVALSYNHPRNLIHEDFGTLRTDYILSDRDTLSAIYTIDNGHSTTPQADPLFGAVETLADQVASIEETHVISPEILNTFRAGFSRAAWNYKSFTFTQFPASTSFVTGLGPGGIVVGGGVSTSGGGTITSAGPNNSSNAWDRRNLFTYTDSVQIIKGRHQITAGVWFQRIQENEDTASRQLGQASFASLTTFLQGTVTSFQVVPDPNELGWRSLFGAAYFEDSIKLRSNLTFQAGLRYEFTTGWNEESGRASNYITGPNGILLTNPLVGGSVYTKNNATHLFGPRAGLAWDVFGNGKTAVRAGYGMYYSLIDNMSFLLNSLPPYNGSESLKGLLPSLVPIAPGVTPAPGTIFAPQGIQPNAKTPTVQEWNFTIEQQLSRDTVLRVGYVGEFGYHGFVSVDPNAIPPQVCSNSAGCSAGGNLATGSIVPQGTLYVPGPKATLPNPNLGAGFFWYTEGNSSYNALQVDVIHRFSHGLQFRANYTWSKNLDINSALTGAQANNQAQMVMDPYDIKRDWGPSAYNIPHAASISGTYELPFGKGKPWANSFNGFGNRLVSGWQFNTIVSLESGFPFTPQIGSNQSGDGDTRNPDRPSLNPAFTGPVVLGSPSQWFNPQAFVLPQAGTFGNLGRGVYSGPGLTDVDASLFKTTSITERTNLQFRAEVFNVMNHPNFGTPNATVFSSGAISPSAGLITTTATTSRQIQFGLKLIF